MIDESHAKERVVDNLKDNLLSVLPLHLKLESRYRRNLLLKLRNMDDNYSLTSESREHNVSRYALLCFHLRDSIILLFELGFSVFGAL